MRAFSWEAIWIPAMPPLEVGVRASIVYLFLVALFRVVPRKELSRYSITDIIALFLVTVSVRRSIVTDDDSVTTALIGLVTIFFWDLCLSSLGRLGSRWSDFIQGKRLVLVRDGKPSLDGIRHAGLSMEELLSRLRSYGTEDLSSVTCAYLERDGKVTFVLQKEGSEKESKPA